MAKKITLTQAHALAKLTREWQSAYELKESLATLRALCNRGVAESKNDAGSFFMPRSCIFFRLRETP